MAAHKDDDEGYKLNGEHVQRSRLRIDTRKWLAGKLKPKKYGDRINLDHAGEIKTVVKVIDLSGNKA